MESAEWLSLPATPGSVAAGRRSVAAFDGLPACAVDTAQIIVSELLTNALEHAGLGPRDLVGLRLTRHGSRLRIDVDDHGRFSGASDDPLRSAACHGGRGLRIVSRLTVHWQATDGFVSAWIEI